MLEFFDWKMWNEESMRYPSRIQYETMSGTNVLNVEEIHAEETLHIDPFMSLFSLPKIPELALDTEF